MSESVTSPPIVRERGHWLEEFAVGQRFEHHWGRTLTAAESILFATTSGNVNPLHFNAEYARAHGHPDTPIDPMLAWNVVFGLSVEDLSFKVAGAGNLGYPLIRFVKDVYPGDTLTAESEVLGIGTWKDATDCGVVHVRTAGRNAAGDVVIEYERKILVRARGGSR